ncbi:MAG: hypothetical protein ABR580_11020, partial [Halomonas sp.]
MPLSPLSEESPVSEQTPVSEETPAGEAASRREPDAISWPPTWPRVLDAEFGPPSAGEYRATPEDFQVAEVLDFAPEGEGEHLWL